MTDSVTPLYEFQLPYPPLINATYKVGHGKFYKDAMAKRYVWTVKAIIDKQQSDALRLDQLLRIDIDFYPKDKRRRDIDSGLKSLLDALQDSEVYINDSQIKRLNLTMHEGNRLLEASYCVVKIYLLV